MKDKDNIKRYKDMVFYFLGTIIVTGLNFFLSILYSYLFLPEEYGDYSLILSAYSLLASFSGGWITLSIVRKAGKFQSEDKYENFKGSIIWTHVLISLTWILVVNIFIAYSQMIRLYKVILFILSLNYFFEYFNNILNYFFRFEGKVKKYNNSIIFRGILKIVGIVFVYYVVQIHSVIVLPVTLLISEMIISAFWFGKTKIFNCLRMNRISLSIIKEVFIFGLPLIAVSASSWILNAADKYIIRIFYSSQEVGVYSYAHQIGSAVSNLIAQFIMLGAYPEMVKAWEKSGKEKATEVAERYLNIYLHLCIPLAIGVTFVGRLFFSELIDKQYHDGAWIFIFTCYGMLMMGLSQYPNKAWELTNRTAGILRLNIEAAVINIILNFIFVPLAGYKWAAVTTFLSFSIYFLLAMYRSRNILRIRFRWRSIAHTIISSGLMGMYILLIGKMLKDSLVKLLLMVSGGFLVYSVGMILFKEINLRDIKQMVINKDKVKLER